MPGTCWHVSDTEVYTQRKSLMYTIFSCTRLISAMQQLTSDKHCQLNKEQYRVSELHQMEAHARHCKVLAACPCFACNDGCTSNSPSAMDSCSMLVLTWWRFVQPLFMSAIASPDPSFAPLHIRNGSDSLDPLFSPSHTCRGSPAPAVCRTTCYSAYTNPAKPIALSY
jgi:hypothetical protein